MLGWGIHLLYSLICFGLCELKILVKNKKRVYSDATLSTEQISEYIWMPYIYQKRRSIYSYSRNSMNMNKINS